MKRRIIYMADDQWERLRVKAKDKGVTISDVIRSLTASTPRKATKVVAIRPISPEDIEDQPVFRATHEAGMKRFEAGYSSRPFTPVPKKG